MKSLRFALTIVLFVACCTSERAPVPEPAPVLGETHGKPHAPVLVGATIEGARARVRVRFEAAGTASVRAYGVRGATVAGKDVLAQDRAVSAGDELTYDVELSTTEAQKGEPESLLVVEVRGDFGAGLRTKVTSFVVAKGRTEAPEVRVIDGERIQLSR